MTNEELAGKISNQINDLEKGMKEAIKPLSEEVGELEAAMTRMRANLQEQINMDARVYERLQERVAKIEQAKTTWGERGKQMGMGMVGAAVVMGGAALIDWAFSGSVTTNQQ